MKNSLAQRQEALLDINVMWLRQAIELVQGISLEQFTLAPAGWDPHRVSGHLRHILEFYECFLDGLDWSQIDYDARRRDESLERSRAAACTRMRNLIQRLETIPQLRGDAVVWVRMEDCEGRGVQDPWTTSSISRELQVLSSHTIHHFALIAMTLRAHGVRTEPNFGVAPSTLRYRKNKMAASAEAA
jgi:hypothetical protein